MNEKKNTGFAALILSLIVVVVAVLAVKFAGGTAAEDLRYWGGLLRQFFAFT